MADEDNKIWIPLKEIEEKLLPLVRELEAVIHVDGGRKGPGGRRKLKSTAALDISEVDRIGALMDAVIHGWGGPPVVPGRRYWGGQKEG
jgi:hypothetical protein